MDIRNKYQKEGRCYFPIKSIDEKFYNYLSEHYKSNDGTTHLRDKFWPGPVGGFRSGFRFDADDEPPADEVNYTDHNKPFRELDLKKTELAEEYKNWNISQIWFFSNVYDDKIRRGRDNIVKYLYDLEDDELMPDDNIELTLYNQQCRFCQHTDGPEAGYLCSVVIYLNENYDISRGGLFDGEEQLSPEFGMCMVQDMTEHDFKHGVTEVTSGERYALLSFPMLKGMKGYEN